MKKIKYNHNTHQVNIAYGMRFADVFEGTADRFQYGGKELDRFSGLDLHDFSARWYDQQLGRFTTPDPLSELNENNPPIYDVHSHPKEILSSKASDVDMKNNEKTVDIILGFTKDNNNGTVGSETVVGSTGNNYNIVREVGFYTNKHIYSIKYPNFIKLINKIHKYEKP